MHWHDVGANVGGGLPVPCCPWFSQDIQEMFSDYLAERGIDDDLANFIPAYIDLKENKEYLRWLGNLQTFFAAK